MEFLEKMSAIQNHILEFLDNDDSNFDELSQLLSYQPDQFDIQELKSVLYLISKISKNHHRGRFFLDKIKRIIIHLKDVIKQTLSNREIFNFFKRSNLLLLLLIKEELLVFDSTLGTIKNEDYFLPEIAKINGNENEISLPEDYEERRLKGENHTYLCEIIRNDDIDNFVISYNKNEFSLSMEIQPSIYETNSFLIHRKLTLIEYSMFFGAFKIIRFLFQNNVIFKPSLWIFAIHSNNPEIVHFLEENRIRPDDLSYRECLTISIKCHHNDFALYFNDNFVKDNDIKKLYYYGNYIAFAFRYYNYQFIPTECNEKLYFYYAIEFGHLRLVEYYKNIEGLNINDKIIQIDNHLFKSNLLKNILTEFRQKLLLIIFI